MPSRTSDEGAGSKRRSKVEITDHRRPAVHRPASGTMGSAAAPDEAGFGLEPATATLATGSRLEDRYEIPGELGSGSCGRVYRVRQLSTGRLLAIPLLAPRKGTDAVRPAAQ